MSEPVLTVGISFLNCADTLRDTLQCMYAQTFTDWELILVDDGSADGGAEIIREVDDPRVILIADGKNLGRAKRYNQITELARGEFIARYDADDLILPERFETQVAYLRDHPDIDVVSSSMFSIDEQDHLRGRRDYPIDHEQICREPLQHLHIAHGPMMGRTEWFRRFPYVDYPIAVDYALWMSSYLDSRFASINEPLYCYREYTTHSRGKYLRTQKAMLGIIRQFGRRDHTRMQVYWAMATHILRGVVMGTAASFGFHRMLIKRRSMNFSEADRKYYERSLETIRAVRIPGMETAESGV